MTEYGRVASGAKQSAGLGLALKGLLAAGVLMVATGCETGGSDYGSEPSISIPYNPYDFDPDELMAQAQAHCSAFGLRAVYVDETIDPNSVRWRYRHFSCV